MRFLAIFYLDGSIWKLLAFPQVDSASLCCVAQLVLSELTAPLAGTNCWTDAFM